MKTKNKNKESCALPEAGSQGKKGMTRREVLRDMGKAVYVVPTLTVFKPPRKRRPEMDSPPPPHRIKIIPRHTPASFFQTREKKNSRLKRISSRIFEVEKAEHLLNFHAHVNAYQTLMKHLIPLPKFIHPAPKSLLF